MVLTIKEFHNKVYIGYDSGTCDYLVLDENQFSYRFLDYDYYDKFDKYKKYKMAILDLFITDDKRVFYATPLGLYVNNGDFSSKSKIYF